MIVKYLKIGLAVLLLLCLLDMPYGFYELVRFIALIIFGFLAYDVDQRKQNFFVVIYVVLALLFQPFLKVALGRELWNIVDFVVAIFLITTWIIDLINNESIEG